MSEFLASIEAKHEPWLRALIENAYNLAVKRCNSPKQQHQQPDYGIPMET